MTAKNTWLLTKAAASSWVDDYAQSMGAALAYYTMLSIAPFLWIVLSLAGMIFGVEAARGEIAAQLQGLMGREGAEAVQKLLESARRPAEGFASAVAGLVLLLVAATSVFAELQDRSIESGVLRSGRGGESGACCARACSRSEPSPASAFC